MVVGLRLIIRSSLHVVKFNVLGEDEPETSILHQRVSNQTLEIAHAQKIIHHVPPPTSFDCVRYSHFFKKLPFSAVFPVVCSVTWRCYWRMLWQPFLVVLFARQASTLDEVQGTVFLDSHGSWSMKADVVDKEHGVAYGSFQDLISTTGWSHLNVRAGYGSSHYTDSQLMYAAGYLEGALTARRIFQHHQNRYMNMFGSRSSSVLEKVKEFFHQQEAWMVKQAKSVVDDSFWTHVMLIYQQFNGLVDGYAANHGPDEELDRFAFQFLNGDGDLYDLIDALDTSSAPVWDSMTPEEMRANIIKRTHCSVLIKVLPGYEDILAGHTTWNTYTTMLRVYKHYDLNIADPTTGSRTLSFSSYPGYLESLDDFYILGNGMVMLQTSFVLFNTSLYNGMTPEALLAWQRVRVACQAAHDTSEWMELIGRYNSGTYNNQYMILDLNKVKLKDSIKDGAFGVAEQLPGRVVSHDQTAILREGYWASYNSPFYEEVYEEAGYGTYVAENSSIWSFQLGPRAEIFRRDQGKVVDIDSLRRLLYYNNYTTEEYSNGDPCNTICCRGDLGTHTAFFAGPYGCYDVKVTNYSMALQRAAYGTSGPTTEGGLPPFSFTGKYSETPHLGMPITWDFACSLLKPKAEF